MTVGLVGVRADDKADALAKLDEIPVPLGTTGITPTKISPQLVVTSRGVLINDAKTPVPFDRVLEALANLPKEAWPNGRTIIYYPSPPGVHYREDEPKASDVKRVEADLKLAGIKLEYGVSV